MENQIFEFFLLFYVSDILNLYLDPDRDIKRKANKHSKYINNNRNAKLPQNNAKICKTEVYENFKTHKVDQIKNKGKRH